jgi:hypothetical protein
MNASGLGLARHPRAARRGAGRRDRRPPAPTAHSTRLRDGPAVVAYGTMGLLDDWVRAGLLDRRHFLAVSGTALTSIATAWPTAEQDRLTNALNGGCAGNPLLDQIEQSIPMLQRLDDANGGGAHLPYVGAQLHGRPAAVRGSAPGFRRAAAVCSPCRTRTACRVDGAGRWKARPGPAVPVHSAAGGTRGRVPLHGCTRARRPCIPGCEPRLSRRRGPPGRGRRPCRRHRVRRRARLGCRPALPTATPSPDGSTTSNVPTQRAGPDDQS